MPLQQRLTQWLTQTLQQRSQQLDLQARLQANPMLRFASIAELTLAATLGVEIDANKAHVEDWLRLPGISIHQARMLMQLSQSGVQFSGIEDLAAALGLPVTSVQPLAPILKFYYYDIELLPVAPRINPNRATLRQLLQLPGVDEAIAQEICHQRLAVGPFRNLADFQLRLKLPGTVISDLMHSLQF